MAEISMISKVSSRTTRGSTFRMSSRLSTAPSENERARLIADMYADKENQPFESTRVSSANLLQEQMMSSQTQVSFQLKLIFFFSKIEEWKKI